MSILRRKGKKIMKTDRRKQNAVFSIGKSGPRQPGQSRIVDLRRQLYSNRKSLGTVPGRIPASVTEYVLGSYLLLSVCSVSLAPLHLTAATLCLSHYRYLSLTQCGRNCFVRPLVRDRSSESNIREPLLRLRDAMQKLN